MSPPGARFLLGGPLGQLCRPSLMLSTTLVNVDHLSLVNHLSLVDHLGVVDHLFVANPLGVNRQKSDKVTRCTQAPSGQLSIFLMYQRSKSSSSSPPPALYIHRYHHPYHETVAMRGWSTQGSAVLQDISLSNTETHHFVIILSLSLFIIV